MFIKKLLFSFGILTASFISFPSQSQTLFTYGDNKVSKDEFLKAFNKNPDTSGSRENNIREYLEMYINFKLKLQAAKDEKLNLSQEFKTEGENFKDQLTENFINDQAGINKLIQQAFERSKKDIQLSQVFVEVKPGDDTTQAFHQISQAFNSLQNGQNFSEVAAAFSSEEAVKQSEENIGYITIFTLPYPIENLVYNLKPGSYSQIYKSNIGYHIFRDASERPAEGKRKIEQILFATPASFTEDERNAVAHLADSVYQQLLNGDSFQKMLELYGAPVSNAEQGNTLEVTVGQYNSNFENNVYSLQNKGDLSKPFLTAYGYNIIKLVDKEPVITDENDVVNRAHLQQQVEESDRLALAKDALIEKWMQQINYKPAAYLKKDLWLYSDSSLKKGQVIPLYNNISPKQVLFTLGNENITVSDWMQFNMEARQTNEPYAYKPYDGIMEEFRKDAAENYYRQHIEDFYLPIAAQLKEFNEANMLFAVMDKHIWSKASTDTAGIKNYFKQHKSQYTWQPGVSALVVSSPVKETLDSVAAQLKEGHNDNWRRIIERYNNSVMADSSRFENGQLPVKQEIPLQKGFISRPEQNDAQDTYTLVCIFDVYPQSGERSFDEARGMVINDYQEVLEKKWIDSLKTKYPVKVNEATLKTLY